MCQWRASGRFATWGLVPRYLRAMSLSSQVPEMGTRAVKSPLRTVSSSQGDKKRRRESDSANFKVKSKPAICKSPWSDH